MKSLPLNRRKWVTKTASENCGVGTTLVKWQHQDHAKCPRCSHARETTHHVFCCDGHGAKEKWNTSFLSFEKYLTSTQTCPAIQRALTDSIRRWRNNRSIPLFEYDHDIRIALRQQHKIGWQDLLEGLPAKQWKILQAQYYRDNNLRKSSNRWLKGVLTQLHHLAWNQWDHRCKTKHNVTKPHELQKETELNAAITCHILQGTDTLLPGDRHHIRHNLLTLLSKPLKLRKAWLLNIIAARQRCQRLQTNDEALEVLSREESLLIRWMKRYTTLHDEA
jgi:hypothetical protein